jgi:hypothetical protein
MAYDLLRSYVTPQCFPSKDVIEHPDKKIIIDNEEDMNQLCLSWRY